MVISWWLEDTALSKKKKKWSDEAEKNNLRGIIWALAVEELGLK